MKYEVYKKSTDTHPVLKHASRSSVMLCLQDLTDAVIWDPFECCYRNSDWQEIEVNSKF